MINGMTRSKRAIARALPALLLGGAATGLSGCGSAPEARPVVPTTAAQLFGSDPAYELDFYDRLDRLPVVSYDDAIHSVLLLNGQSAFSYPQRVALAKQRGLLEDNFNRPPREAVTIGEVAVMIERVITDRVDQSYGGATSRLATRGILPDSARPTQGLTGSQMLAVLGATEDFLLARGEEAEDQAPVASANATIETPPAQVDGEDAFAGFEEEPAVVVRPEEPAPVTAAPTPAPDQERRVADVEPLPELPDEEPAQWAEEPDVAAPAPMVESETQVEPEPEVAPAEPEEEPQQVEQPRQPEKKSKWVPGKPLRQGGR